jgi:hypothetical protein
MSYAARAVERQPDIRQVLDGAAQTQRCAGGHTEWKQRDADAAAAPLELQDVDHRLPIPGSVVGRRLRLVHLAADEVLERMVVEVQRPRVEPVVADADPLPPRAGRFMRLSAGVRRWRK